MRVDPDPSGSEPALLGQYVDFQRQTMAQKPRASWMETSANNGVTAHS